MLSLQITNKKVDFYLVKGFVETIFKKLCIDESRYTLTPVEENGQIYIINKKTGKKYVYDEQSVYEEKQDNVQANINYDQHETDSTLDAYLNPYKFNFENKKAHP